MEEIKELKQFKLDHEEQLKKWRSKVEASAGDVQDTITLISRENHQAKSKITALENKLKEVELENNILRDILHNSNLNTDIKDLQKMLESC